MKLGLNDAEVKESINKYGKNEMLPPKPRRLINVILESFSDPIIKILLIALGIKIVFMFQNFDWYETLGIIIAIFLATFISSISEYGSETAFKKLQEENKDISCKVYRNNKLVSIKMKEVVVNDIVFLEAGDIIPADGTLYSGKIKADESILTGESKLVSKINRDSKLYKGTVVSDGSCNMLVNKVGESTLYGSITKEIVETKNVSPLKKRLLKLAKVINKAGYIGSFLVAISYLFSVIVIKNNFNIDIIKRYIDNRLFISDLIYAVTLSVTTIVVAVPEGLPMMITLVLSSNMKKMIKNNVLVRKMTGIETAGNINFLLTDKTGTITEGNLKVVNYITVDFHSYKNIKDIKGKIYEDIYESLIYNNASSIVDGNIIGGNQTDQAILRFIENIYDGKKCKSNYIPFDSTNKTSEVYINNKHYIKGAYEVLTSKATHYMSLDGKLHIVDKNKVNKYVSSLTRKGYRVIANALVRDDTYILLGIITIKDVIRKESFEGIKIIKNAGINVIMVTGDNKETASKIASEVGIINNPSDKCITSKELSLLSDEDILREINSIKVIARSYPSDKSRIVKILQEAGYVVGMTGDGVNDAPALKKADVGFAMGTGTSIAKESSDIIILDNNLLSISKAVLYGRTIFKSIRKFVKYQLSINFCALSLSVIGPFIGITTPITIVQMLWLNMIMDTFAALAFSYEPSLDKYMNESPKDIKEPVISKKVYMEIITNGIFSALICILFLKLPIFKGIYLTNKEFMTAYFALFIFIGINVAFMTRSNKVNYLKGITKNPLFIITFIFIIICQLLIINFGGSIFSTYGLSISGLINVVIISLLIIIPNTVVKIINKEKDD